METVLSKRRRLLKERRRREALRRLGNAAELLYAEGARDVYIFGSVIKPLAFDERSDVDIAVSGLSGERYVSAVKKLEEVLGEIPFDLIFLEERVRPEVKNRIMKEGIRWMH